MSESKSNVTHGIVSLEKQAHIHVWIILPKKSAHFPLVFTPLIHPRSDLLWGVKSNPSSSDLMCLLLMSFYLNSTCQFHNFSPKSPLYIPNDLEIDLHRSNLYGKEWELDCWIPVSVNCGWRERWSSGSDGSLVAMCLVGIICHHPSGLRICFVTPCTVLAFVTVLLCQNKTHKMSQK